MPMLYSAVLVFEQPLKRWISKLFFGGTEFMTTVAFYDPIIESFRGALKGAF
ncbi:hypothetical protein QWZ13_18345 [Reinekea marina]|uniref:hypothetical protein n=1 Tax=Reinekea marina TaxID=1310421 RepID=UPI0025B4F84F|nr:hypothetical protein [Reinekea marina]MDN3650872.1 hypothetical protein [Reinekea marina]